MYHCDLSFDIVDSTALTERLGDSVFTRPLLGFDSKRRERRFGPAMRRFQFGNRLSEGDRGHA